MTYTVRAVFSVSSWEKGPRTSEIAIETSSDEPSCGYGGFAAGGEYEVFAGLGKDARGRTRYVTGLCSGTRKLDQP
jgi:hypothetical protein